MNRTIEVALGERSYLIRIGAGLLDDAAEWRDSLRGRHALVVTDTQVAPLYLDRVRAGLASHAHDTLVLPAGESSKTLESTERIFDALARLGANRDGAGEAA